MALFSELKHSCPLTKQPQSVRGTSRIVGPASCLAPTLAELPFILAPFSYLLIQLYRAFLHMMRRYATSVSDTESLKSCE
jgi:hypothetical protein